LGIFGTGFARLPSPLLIQLATVTEQIKRSGRQEMFE
jgi:hypothetical protein